jgi:hypothetical protein
MSPPIPATPTVEAMRKLDPMRAHGAWIYLCTSIAAGALIGANYGVEPAMLVGTSFAGAFLTLAGIAVGASRKRRQIVTGLGLAILATLGALTFHANPPYLIVISLAAIIAITTVILARRFGYLAHSTMLAGVAALAMAAPVSAVAGGATFARAALLFFLLWPVYSWRTFLVAAEFTTGNCTTAQLRARGLREAALAALWSLAVAITLRIF